MSVSVFRRECQKFFDWIKCLSVFLYDFQMLRLRMRPTRRSNAHASCTYVVSNAHASYACKDFP